MLHVYFLFPSSLAVMNCLIFVFFFPFLHSFIFSFLFPLYITPASLTETYLCLAPLKSTHNWLFPATLYQRHVVNVPVTL